jgi:Cu/Ag efflux pump CusA
MPLVVSSGAGAAARWSLGTAVVTGMAAATVLSLFFIPVLYYGIQTLVEKVKGRPAAPLPIQAEAPGPAGKA